MSNSDYPQLVEQLDYEELLQQTLSKAREIDGWTAEFESDPIMKLCEIPAYRELAIRARINHVALSNVVRFARGSDLDEAAGWYGATRLPGESDERFKYRLGYVIAALAGNGTHESYIAKALGAHIEVVDVVAYRPRRGCVNVAVQGSATALQAVRAALTGDKEMLGIDVDVFMAKRQRFTIRAEATVDSSAPTTINDVLIDRIRAGAVTQRAFGRSLALSQITAWIHGDWVQKVVIQSPITDIEVPRDALWDIADIELAVIRA